MGYWQGSCSREYWALLSKLGRSGGCWKLFGTMKHALCNQYTESMMNGNRTQCPFVFAWLFLQYFVCKYHNHLFELDLDRMTYKRQSTRNGLFDGTPDQLRTVVDDNQGRMIYFSEDGGDRAGIHAMNASGVITILEGIYEPETTGLSFSPDFKRMCKSWRRISMYFLAVPHPSCHVIWNWLTVVYCRLCLPGRRTYVRSVKTRSETFPSIVDSKSEEAQFRGNSRCYTPETTAWSLRKHLLLCPNEDKA